MNFQNIMRIIDFDTTLSCDEKEEFEDENLEGMLVFIVEIQNIS